MDLNKDRVMFIVPKGHTVRSAIESIAEKSNKVIQVWLDYGKRVGAEDVVGNGTYIVGLRFTNKQRLAVPDFYDLWTVVKGRSTSHTCYRPNFRTNKEEAKLWKALPVNKVADDFWLAGKFDMGIPFTGSGMAIPNYKLVGDTLFMSLHKEHKVPEGLEPCKQSDYCLALEALEDAADPMS